MSRSSWVLIRPRFLFQSLPPPSGGTTIRCRTLLLALVSLVAVSVALALTWPSVEATGEASGQPTAVTLPWVHQHQGAGNRPPIPLTRIGFVAWITTQVLRARRRPKSVGEVMSA